MYRLLLIVAFAVATNICCGQVKIPASPQKVSKTSTGPQKTQRANKPILPGAWQTKEYLPLLQGKRVGVFANHTATIKSVHLVDTLKKLGVNIVKIFGPEHGFRGTANAGEKVANYKDETTGIPVISLYGSKRKPTEKDLEDVDILLFDIQDVGVRFYTYISSLQEFMESAMEFDKPLVILDRPNPNGFYVDGPVLDTAFRSFVGMQPIPIVHGMTIGEYANFLIGEGLLDKKTMTLWMSRIVAKAKKADTLQAGNGLNFTIIKCRNYTHSSKYILPEKPSPNLPDMGAIYWYPSTCLFEGTVISEGRGTSQPFQVFGHPALPKTLYSFTPVANEGASQPKYKNQVCYGWNVAGPIDDILKKINNRLQLTYLLDAYKLFADKDGFFIKSRTAADHPQSYFFNKLAGNATLMAQIKQGISEEIIRNSWEPKLSVYKKTRKKYLLYEDFE